jgi:hypothetical protein
MPKILIIEDDPKIKEALALKLEKSGFEVISVGDGKPGIVETIQEKPDLITLDLMMPEMGGEITLKYLKETQETKDIPVIILTVVPQSVPEKLHGGEIFKTAAAYLEKDKITLEEIVDKIKETLKIPKE